MGVLALAVFFLGGALKIRVSPSYAHIGPRFFPFLVSGGLAACGLPLLAQALRDRSGPAQEGGASGRGAAVNWGAIAVIGVALLLQLLLIERAGFVLASAALFWGVAFSFGSRRYVRDGLIGLLLALAVYLAFTRLLDLNLPGGILTTILGRATGGS
ncbi:tripartite tricarboxylate transporter TctB family protein [Limnochorda pilosa]|uniref:Tripartite tricarboxylate transporter TctB n=1 Tax=Limnochorda pilosa TaxID=1555112 RepID=A0A0K2SGM5_LIMPI|nr:tripartite tricarboxylate transporter TctB family protein [Limnochorda pilosa]BAS26263.1 tripartite tricarboxylate transporter TctB [Limnochorda pilosa]